MDLIMVNKGQLDPLQTNLMCLRNTWNLKKQRHALTSEKNVTDGICVKPQIFIFNEKILKVCHSVHIFI